MQDSTIIKLPTRLYDIFSGVKNGTSTTCNARIQVIYDLLHGQYIHFSIDTYSKNDLLAAPEINVEKGDLVLRDRGYFVLNVIFELKKNGADLITRYKHKTVFYDLDDNQINLLELLKQNGSIDMVVLAGETKQRIRLMTAPAEEEVANLRRMRARKEAKKKAPSKELLELASWNIFLTTMEDPELKIRQVTELYGLRWRIENIFRTWKSFLSFERIHNVSKRQLEILLRARFIMIVLSYNHIYTPLSIRVYENCSKHLSLMKFMSYIQKDTNMIVKMLTGEYWTTSLMAAICRHCVYEQRKRKHFMEKAGTVLKNVA